MGFLPPATKCWWSTCSAGRLGHGGRPVGVQRLLGLHCLLCRNRCHAFWGAAPCMVAGALLRFWEWTERLSGDTNDHVLAYCCRAPTVTGWKLCQRPACSPAAICCKGSAPAQAPAAADIHTVWGASACSAPELIRSSRGRRPL